MVLKRKRSDSEISISSSLFSSPPGGINFMNVDSPQFTIPTPALFHSRTRKRHRDNRPSESQVHQHTLSILFGAQQAQTQLPIVPPIPSQTPVVAISGQPSSQQSSLHSFWTLPSKPRSGSSSNTSCTFSTPSTTPPRDTLSSATNCEDCNACLNAADDGDAMDVDMMAMEVDGNYGCMSCGKNVCHGCAVSNLGADRQCLTCVKPKSIWQGGPGWVPN